MVEFLIAFLISFAASLMLTPLVSKLATAYGFVDRPDGGRKAHEQPVALGGGAAVFVAALISIVLSLGYVAISGSEVFAATDVSVMVGLLVSAILIVLLGLVDDLVGMQGRYKLLGQLAIAGILIYSGIRIDSIAIFQGRPSAKKEAVEVAEASSAALPTEATNAADGDPAASEATADAPKPAEKAKWKKPGLQLGLLAVPFTIFWLLGAINAFNLIDGIDGLASSVGLVLCLTIAAITAWQGNTGETLIMLAFAGALLGFLRFNFAPASIYLGDAGSMLIGLLIGAIAVHSSIKSAATVALAVPCGVWAIPILDSMAAILRRKLTGRSFFAPDRGHLHHSLLVRGWSVRQAVLFIALICTTTCLSAVLSIYFGDERIALATVLLVVIFLISTQTFGHIEFALLKEHLRFSNMPFGKATGNESQIHESRIQLQGARRWDLLWTAIIESAPDYRIARLKLVIHIPALHEDYFASWDARREHKNNTAQMWNISHPIIVDSNVVGQLEIGGMPDGESTLGHMIQVLDFLEPIEDDVQHIMKEIQDAQPKVSVGKIARGSREKVAEESPDASLSADAEISTSQALAKH